jgi:hypothetical protein
MGKADCHEAKYWGKEYFMNGAQTLFQAIKRQDVIDLSSVEREICIGHGW